MRGLTERLTRTLATVEKLERYRGHFYNWYETRTLKPMVPLYISTVDNGNLAGLLLTLHSGLLELVDQNWSAARIVAGLRDTLDVLKEQSRNSGTTTNLEALEKLLAENPTSPAETFQLLDQTIEAAAKLAGAKNESNSEFETWRRIFGQSCLEQREEILAGFPWMNFQGPLQVHLQPDAAQELKKFWEQLNAPMSVDVYKRQARARAEGCDGLY